MKKLLIVFWLISHSLLAQRGVILTESTNSAILKKEIGYSIYLPASYEKSIRKYPVLYLFHGIGGDHTDWVNRGEVARIASEAVENGKAPEMIIVMTNGLTDAFYQNNYDKSLLWEDYFIKELIPTVESKYRIHASRTYRAIAGLSMGGYGSMYMSLRHKELFSMCYAMSGAFVELEPLVAGAKPDGMFENLYVKLWGPRKSDGLPETYKANSIQEMVKAMPEYKAPVSWQDADKALPKFILDCGDDDFLIRPNTNLYHLMKEKKIPVDLRVREGVHNWTYWRSGLEIALEFIGKNFRD